VAVLEGLGELRNVLRAWWAVRIPCTSLHILTTCREQANISTRALSFFIYKKAHHRGSILGKARVFLQLLVQFAARRVLQDDVDARLVVEVAVQPQDVIMPGSGEARRGIRACSLFRTSDLRMRVASSRLQARGLNPSDNHETKTSNKAGQIRTLSATGFQSRAVIDVRHRLSAVAT
jgi:hypothetical protein